MAKIKKPIKLKAVKPKVNTKNENHGISAQEARQMLVNEINKDIEACKLEISESLARHGCRIDAQFLLAEGIVRPIIQVVKRTDQQ